jgi:hypothetical protein
MSFTVLSFAFEEVLASAKMNLLYANASTMYIGGDFAFSPVKTRRVGLTGGAFHGLGASDILVKSIDVYKLVSLGGNEVTHLFIHDLDKLPDGAIITGMYMGYKKDVADAIARCYIYRIDNSANIVTCADATGITVGSWDVASDTSIDNATVNNDDYSYFCILALTNKTSVHQVDISRVEITFTVVIPLP